MDNLFTETEASAIKCPVNKIDSTYCISKECMAWREVECRIKRENHSGADKLMLDAQIKRGSGARVRKEGHGCTGYLILDARGYCELLHKEKQ